MTPAKVLALQKKRDEQLGLGELHMVQLLSMFYNANRYMGDKEKGEPPAPVKSPSDFLIFSRKRKTLAAKDRPGGDHNLLGAKTDKGKWDAWTRGRRGKGKTKVRVKE